MKNLDISDHALIRFIERVKGESLDQYRDEMRALIAEHETTPVPARGSFVDGALFFVDHFAAVPVVVTVLTRQFVGRVGQGWATRTVVHVPEDTL